MGGDFCHVREVRHLRTTSGQCCMECLGYGKASPARQKGAFPLGGPKRYGCVCPVGGAMSDQDIVLTEVLDHPRRRNTRRSITRQQSSLGPVLVYCKAVAASSGPSLGSKRERSYQEESNGDGRRIRASSPYLGVLSPFSSLSMAFPNLFNRVSSFLTSVIQRQYSLRWV